MLDQGREPRASTLDINQPKESQTRTKPWHGVLLGTDFRHAVEFSKSGRVETRPFRASLLAGCPTLRRFPAPPAGDVVRRPSRAARRMENSTRASGPSAGGSRPTPAGHRTTRSEAVTPLPPAGTARSRAGRPA